MFGVVGLVLIRKNHVLSYDDLKSLGFVGPSYSTYYGMGNHGINGLLPIEGHTDIRQFVLANDLNVARVDTPWFDTPDLMAEPEVTARMFTLSIYGCLVNLALDDTSFTNMKFEGGDLEVKAKGSIGFHKSPGRPADFDLLAAIDPKWKKESAPPPPPPKTPRGTAGSYKYSAKPEAEPTSPPPASTPPSMLDGIRSMHRQFEDNAKAAKAKEEFDPSIPKHKQVFSYF
jgi:hypothetical protein